VRVLAATHRDLTRLIEAGAFREDIYYRLKVIEVHVPPLRERREDIPVLTEHFVEQVSLKHGAPRRSLAPDLVRALTQAPWRGNVRQLRNQIEAAVVLSDGETLTLADFEGLAELAEHQESAGASLPALDFSLSFREAKRLYVEQFERAYLVATLERCEGNISKAARVLDMHRQTLQQKLRSLDIQLPTRDD
jgi:two-component system response regulator AtoC/two-component system nitrogen regulation response regulator NtrX